MRQKISLAIAALAATATLTAALAMAGFAPDPAAPMAAPANAAVTTDPSPRVQVDTIYVKPAPTQEVITIEQTASAGEDEGSDHEGQEHEGAGGDD